MQLVGSARCERDLFVRPARHRLRREVWSWNEQGKRKTLFFVSDTRRLDRATSELLLDHALLHEPPS
jgi:hypothetical protein